MQGSNSMDYEHIAGHDGDEDDYFVEDFTDFSQMKYGGKKLTETIDILNMFANHCYNRKKSPVAPRQQMFQKLEVHLLAIEILDMKIKQGKRGQPGLTYCLKKIKKAAAKFICGFIDGYLASELFEHT